MKLRTIVIGTLLLALAASPAWAQDKPQRDRPPAPEAGLKARAEGPLEARRFLEMMHDPLIAGQIAIARIRELALQAKKPDMAVELLEHVAREAEPPPLKRTALFFASELHAKAGRYEAAAETLVKMLRVRDRPEPERAGGEADQLARQARKVHRWLREHPALAARIIASLRGGQAGPAEAPAGQRRRAQAYPFRRPGAMMPGRVPEPLRDMPPAPGGPDVGRRVPRQTPEGLLQLRQREEMRRRLQERREEMERRDQPEARERRESPERRDREKALKGKERPEGPERREREKAVTGKGPEKDVKGKMPEMAVKGKMPEMAGKGKMPEMAGKGKMPHMAAKGKMPHMAAKGKEREKSAERQEGPADKLREYAQDLERLKRQLQERAEALERREKELRSWAEKLEKRQREMERERDRPRER